MRLRLVLLLLLTTVPAWGKTYYVDPQSPSCNDANTSPTAATPWCTVPGTRTPSNSGFLRSAWGTINGTTKIACGDTILLKGGSTYTSARGGAWRVDPTYYAATCTPSTRITITVANSSQWPGSAGHLTINGSGITTTSLRYGNTGICAAGGFCALVDVENVNYVTIGGIDGAQRMRITVVHNQSSNDCGVLLHGNGRKVTRGLEARWFEITGKTGSLDMGGAVEIGDLGDAHVHDIHVHDWLGTGVDTGLSAFRTVQGLGVVDVTVEASGPRSDPGANFNNDAFSFPASAFDDAHGGGGGIWCIRCTAKNQYTSATNSGGCGTQNLDGVVRYREMQAYLGGRTTGTYMTRTGVISSGDACGSGSYNALPEQSVFVFYSTFYNNALWGWSWPHGAGSAHFWNSTFFRSGGTAQFQWNACTAVGQVVNGIVAAGSSRLNVWETANCGAPQTQNNFIPISHNTLYQGTANSDRLSSFGSVCAQRTSKKCKTQSDCAAGEGRCVIQQQSPRTYLDPPGWLVGNANRLGSAFSPRFVSTSGNCDKPFATALSANGYADCDFHLQSGSDAIDVGTFFLKANGAGTNSDVITVKASTPEPYQVGAGYLNWTPAERPHNADPRMYFVGPASFPNAQPDTIQIQNATCDGGNPTVVSMTARTITLDRRCSWADGAGIHLPWAGSAPDMGAYESGFERPASPLLLSVEPLAP